MSDHHLKTWREPFQDVWLGRKTFEFRKDDRGFALGDRLLLEEWDPLRDYSGRAVAAVVTYILVGGAFGVPAGYCIMGIVVDGRCAP